jgi:predicted RNA-binding protein YlqC (UPF0109 family)
MPTEQYTYPAEPEDALSAGALLQEIVRALVDSPHEVAVHESVTDTSVVMAVTCAEADIGKIAGKAGKTVALIERLLGRVEGREKRKVAIKIIRPKRERAT